MSFSVSISTSVTPTAIAGRATGSRMRENTRQGEAPSVRAASAMLRPCMMNTTRAVM
jgi:hypothetical protein